VVSAIEFPSTLPADQKAGRRSQAARRKEMREIVARAAFDEIAEFGYSEFRTAAVFSRAGVSKGGMQHHFPTKASLTLAAIDYGLNESTQIAEQNLLKTINGPTDLARLLVDDLVSYFSNQRFWVTLDITIHASKNGELAQAIHQAVDRYRTPVYESWAKRLESEGWATDKAQDIVHLATAMVSGSAIRHLWTGEGPLPSIRQLWIDVILMNRSQ
jgi:AcrR family transcriptional regulator